MKNNAQTGQNAELLARDYLLKKNYFILFTNWRHKHAEIDIIAQDGKVVVFIEVKARKNNSFGHPEEFVDSHKKKKMHDAAEGYLEQFNWEGELRFDIIAIENNNKIIHFEDAFY
ncbi:MAG: YraN family protein [Chitinophagales bacterium]